MQNKGLVKFFAILFALVSIYQLSFTFVASKVKSDAKAFAAGKPEKEIKYLDSIGKEKVFLDFFTYNEVKDKQINKGLDLEGGINVILQISVKDVLKFSKRRFCSINLESMLLFTLEFSLYFTFIILLPQTMHWSISLEDFD